jgi:hypothetical protein
VLVSDGSEGKSETPPAPPKRKWNLLGWHHMAAHRPKYTRERTMAATKHEPANPSRFFRHITSRVELDQMFEHAVRGCKAADKHGYSLFSFDREIGAYRGIPTKQVRIVGLQPFTCNSTPDVYFHPWIDDWNVSAAPRFCP